MLIEQMPIPKPSCAKSKKREENSGKFCPWLFVTDSIVPGAYLRLRFLIA